MKQNPPLKSFTIEYVGRVLVVDDDIDYIDLVSNHLDHHGFTVSSAKNLSEMREKMKSVLFDAVLLDLVLEHEDGLEGLPFIVSHFPLTKIFMMSAFGTIEIAVDALEKGASSFISKSKNPSDIAQEISRRFATQKKLTSLKRQGANASDADMIEDPWGNAYYPYGIIGHSAPIRNIIDQINRLKDVDSTVLIMGESGTGKELVARAIYSGSKRNTARFEAINCGAIPEALLESELFGHKRGSFTDAKSDRKGIFERCNGGVLFLDEIGEMPFSLQVKLLRALQEREITPIGSGETIKIDTRVVAATNRNLLEEVRSGRVREDLYFRLAVLTLYVPALRERAEDIPLIARYFIEVFSRRFKKIIQPLSRELEIKLMNHSWPGNIRELQNSIERAVVMTKEGHLGLDDLIPPNILSPDAKQTIVTAVGINPRVPLTEAKSEFEQNYLHQLLEMTKGNISEMARISGRYRADIYKLLSKHGIEWDDFRNTL